MGQKKLARFAALKTFSNVREFPADAAGNWHTFFDNKHPLILELACGKGEYAIGLGKLHPDQNFIGVDIKGNRIWVGARKAQEAGLKNVGFLRTQIEQLTTFFAPGEVEEIWITFPDPQLRFSKAKKRLTHPRFLRLYQQILKPEGKIHLKTDSPALYQFTQLVTDHYACPVHQQLDNVYQQTSIAAELSIKTHYESLDIAGSNRIHYCCFSLPPTLLDPQLEKTFKERLAIHETETLH
jgi:tRNA (guanine-N7-)-methyltransferase